MEDRALYHSILAAPHDDAPRLVYADWLDDRAATEPDLPARRLRARAELIRVQVALARSGPGGWKRDKPRPPELVARERRLLFRIGRKLRAEVPFGMASAPFDRGFLRPFRALRPHEFLAPLEDVSRPLMARFPYRSRLPELLPDGADPWNAAPLWDVHLFASGWEHDLAADEGQYGPLLKEVGQSARMERVGWLKVSFARTPVLNFLRYGRFPNVETLVLNSGPFPVVLHAVAENESFRSLRYVWFGDDEWLWASTFADRQRFREVAREVHQLNAKHLPFGSMRSALAGVAIAPDPVVSALREFLAQPMPFRERLAASTPAAQANSEGSWQWLALWGLIVAVGLIFAAGEGREPSVPRINMPEFQPLQKVDLGKYKLRLTPEGHLQVIEQFEGFDPKPEMAPPPRARE